MKLIVLQAAQSDLARLHAFLADNNPRAADRAVAALIAGLESLENFPERGRPSGTANVRELIVRFGHSGYVIRYAYRADTDEVVVIRIWHGRELRE